MAEYKVSLTQEAMRGAKTLQKSNTAAFHKLSILIEELKVHPQTGTGKPERLRYVSGLWSRRIDKHNRLVYSIHDEVVEVIVVSVMGHYGDK